MADLRRPSVSDDPAERIRVKRIYRAERVSDGRRILVDRLWPRGISKDRARLFAWERGVAPSDGLRRWYHEDLDRWEAFKDRYRSELDAAPELVGKITDYARDGVVTLIYAAKNEDRNHALVLRDYLSQWLRTEGRA